METAKINKTLVCVRTYYVPMNIEFRYKRRWWKKRGLTEAIAVGSDVVTIDVPFGAIVAMFKDKLPRNEYQHILKEL